MEIDIVDAVTLLGYSFMLVGLCSLGYGLYTPQPDMNVSYVTEFNQTYAEKATSDTISILSDDDSDIDPIDVHVTINESQIDENNTEKLRDIIDTNETAIIEMPNELRFDDFIVEFGEEDYQVYTSTPESLTSSQLTVGGMIMIFSGLIIIANMRAAKAYKPDDIVESDDGEWEYYIDDEDD